MPVLIQTKRLYKTWQRLSENKSKPFRFGLGGKIEQLFITILELEFKTKYATTYEKLSLLVTLQEITDLLKFFLQVAWENKYLSDKQYGIILREIEEISKSIYHWRYYCEKKKNS